MLSPRTPLEVALNDGVVTTSSALGTSNTVYTSDVRVVLPVPAFT